MAILKVPNADITQTAHRHQEYMTMWGSLRLTPITTARWATCNSRVKVMIVTTDR